MKPIRNKTLIIKRTLVIMPVIILICFLVDVIYIHQFNKQVHRFAMLDEEYSVGMNIDGRANSTSEWKKRDFNMYGRTVVLNAQTIDGTLVNDTKYEIRDWKLRIDFQDECFFNNAWCGTVEIHQNVASDEKVQTLDLRDYRIDDVYLDYLFDGDLLIHLLPGDYIIYYPSVKDSEVPIDNFSQMTMGFIIYYLDFPDMSMREIDYFFNRKITDGHAIYILGGLGLVWILLLIIYAVYFLTYRFAVKEMESKKSGIASMSDMYAIIYIIDIIKDELMPVVADEESEKLRPKNMPASEQLKNMFKFDCEEAYQDVAYEFCDLTTLDERLENRKTVVFEYKSKFYGWCRIRFFGMDREKNHPLEKVVFTIQVINEEKEEMEAIAERVDIAEHESKVKSTFLANMSHEIRTPINAVIGFNTMILRESREPVIKSYAKTINSAANMLLSIINGILDISKLEADKMELEPSEYSFRQMVSEIVAMIKGRPEFGRLEFICDVAPDIPVGLYGDSVRLKQVIINLLTNAAKYTEEGSVKLSIRGSRREDVEILDVSVKDTGIGIREEDLKKLSERFSRFDKERNRSIEGTGLGLNLVTGILTLMGSELKVASVYGEGSEFSFALEQKVVGEEMLGTMDFEIEAEAGEYRTLFTAPEAKILVVDDNEMNLSVFKNLLKETKIQIDTANSGRAAIEKCASTRYDLIFMDHMMPGMDGVECFKNIRSLDGSLNRETPVIILTANALKGAKEEYDAIGFDDFLAKPIVADQLERMVVKHLDRALVEDGARTEGLTQEEEVEVPVLTGVDASYGIAHTGDLKSYLALLKQVNSVGAGELKELKEYLVRLSEDTDDHEALHDFRIKIHSMKSTANILGALKMYGIAATIEEQAAGERVEDVIGLSPYFIDGWERMAGEIREYFGAEDKEVGAVDGDVNGNAGGNGNGNGRKALDAEVVNEYLHMLETSIKAYDIKNADAVVEKLKGFSFNEEQMEYVSRLEVAVANLDADGVIEICDALRMKEV